jgi:hypothetical protein
MMMSLQKKATPAVPSNRERGLSGVLVVLWEAVKHHSAN